MNILHLLTNRKWTERAEPAADLAIAQRDAGAPVLFACTQPEPGKPLDAATATHARNKGLLPLLLASGKHFGWKALRKDQAYLQNLVRDRGIGILHAHMENGHLLAALTARRIKPRPLIVRSSYEKDGPKHGFRERILLRWYTDGLIVISENARQRAIEEFKVPEDKLTVIEPGIDLARFDPARDLADADRAAFGLPADALVVGVLSRLRRDRKVDLVLRAVHAARRKCPALHLLICGRGEAESDLRRLTGELGGPDWVTFGGYCRGDRLPAAYRAMDLLAYPAHGTDQSCRTIREALASGTPVMATDEGFASELIADGQTGWLLVGDPDAWRFKLEYIAANRGGLTAMRASALSEARRRFSLPLQAQRTLAFYQRLQAAKVDGLQA